MAAMLALVGRLVSGSLVVDPGALEEMSVLWAAAVECQPGADGAHSGKPERPPPDTGLAALASILGQPAPLLAAAVGLPAPRPAGLGRAMPLPTGRAPPACRSGAALPRGPPS